MDKNDIKKLAIKLANKNGLINISRDSLCKAAGIPVGSFPNIVGCSFSDFIAELYAEGVTGSRGPVHKSRTSPDLRRESILIEAVRLAKSKGYHNITRDQIAQRANVSVGLVSRYLGTMPQLRRDIMRAAIRQEIPEIVAQGLANGDRHARKAPPELRKQAAEHLANL